MKKTAVSKDIFREIKNTPGRFLSIFLIIALGVGFFSGFKATAPSMKSSAEDYFCQNNLFDLEILSNIGFNDDDVAAVKDVDGVEGARGGYSVDGIFKDSESRENVVKILSLPGDDEDEINMPLITDGRMPENDSECLFMVSQHYKENYNDTFQVGDTIVIEDTAGKTDMNSILNQKTYTISGIAKFPQYIAYSMGTSSVGTGTVAAAMMVSKGNFKYSRYTEIYSTLELNGISDFDEAYQDKIAEMTKVLEKTGLTQYQKFINLSQEEIAEAELKLQAGQDEVNKQLKDAQDQLYEAEEQIAEGEQELLQGENNYNQLSAETAARLQAARSELDSNWATYHQSKSEYDVSYQTYQASENEYNQAYAEYEQARAEYEEKKSELSPIEIIYYETKFRNAEFVLEKAREQLDAAKAELSEAEKGLSTAKSKLDAGEKEYAAAYAQAERELAEGRNQLNNGYDALDSAKAEYYYGLAQYNESVQKAKAELDNGQNQLLNAKNSLTNVQDGKWYVLDREDVLFNYSNFQGDTDRLDAISNIFPVFFLLVAALVCMTTMTRMVDEQRMQIGTYKALGYKSGEILKKYVVYSGLAGIIGCIIGPTIFISILPKVIYSIYSGEGGLYFLPWFKIKIPWLMLGISFLVAMLCTILPAIIQCGKELRHPAATLMRPKAPKAGKRIFLENMPFFWNHCSFFRKLTIRNIFRYKLRVLMSVVGIAGGMALILAGFSLQNSVLPVVGLQFNDIEHDDIMFYLNDSGSEAQYGPIKVALNQDERIKDTILLSRNELKGFNMDQSTVVEYTYLIAPTDNESLERFFTLRDYKTDELLKLDDDGAIITKKMAKTLNVQAGDSMIIQLGDHQYTIKISGVADNYTFHYVYMTPAYFKKVTGEDLTYNMIYAQQSEKLTDTEAFRQEWMAKDGNFSMIYFISDTKDMLADILTSMSMVVLVMIISAGLLTFIVLYCLTNINIEERTREIATVKVLGFNRKEVNSYIFRENIIITVIAIIVGAVAGYALGQLMINTIEVSQHCFCHDVKLTSFLYSAGLTALFTILVNFVMSKKIPKISMVESLKAVE